VKPQVKLLGVGSCSQYVFERVALAALRDVLVTALQFADEIAYQRCPRFGLPAQQSADGEHCLAQASPLPAGHCFLEDPGKAQGLWRGSRQGICNGFQCFCGKGIFSRGARDLEVQLAEVVRRRRGLLRSELQQGFAGNLGRSRDVAAIRLPVAVGGRRSIIRARLRGGFPCLRHSIDPCVADSGGKAACGWPLAVRDDYAYVSFG